jgi:hypothetical protein
MVLLAWGSSVLRVLLMVVSPQATVTVRAAAGVRAASTTHSGTAIRLNSSFEAKWGTKPPFSGRGRVKNGVSVEARGTLRN